jgi:predicted CXXCH cytochrome family protein
MSPGVPDVDEGTGHEFHRLRCVGALVVVAAMLLGAGCARPRPEADADSWDAPAVNPHLATARFIGSNACAGCHAGETAAWRSSQHARAMQHATEQTVLGDFADVRFRYAGVESRFFRRDGRWFVRTDGADGQLADFEIRYTFGVEPLQQYLVEFPDGRLQALSIAWDTRPKAAGGQRWFHLYPGQHIDHRDELHWTRAAQNWNFMCADCHATDVRKNYHAVQNRYWTTWSELSVGCEACHGPGSAHLAWARAGGPSAAATAAPARTDPTRGLTVLLDERRGVRWLPDATSGKPVRSLPRASGRELEVCAQCHARRSQVAEGYRAGAPFLDHYRPALLDGQLYHADGQQLDEVFTWGSFLQSRMQHTGVTCSDCHEPHGGRLRADGNAVCAQCHAARKYDSAAHHRHESQSQTSGAGHAAAADGTRCVDCHMPPTTYMVVDPRRDHGFRVPRPELTVSLGVPNACTACHAGRDAGWAVDVLQRWYGRQPRGFQQYAPAFAAAAQRAAEAGPRLAAVVGDASNPPIARASALEALGSLPSPDSVEAARALVSSADPLLRRGAIAALEPLPPGPRLAALAPLLEDPLRSIRIDAADALADTMVGATPAERQAFERAAAEFETTHHYSADRAESRAALGNFYARQARYEEAERGLEAALALDPGFVPAYVNLADLQRETARDADSERTLRRGLAQAGEHAALKHALGLALVRLGRYEAALAELARATQLEPDDAHYAYVHAVALHSAGRVADALRELDRALARHPDDRDLLMTAAIYGGTEHGEKYARRLAERYRGDPAIGQFLAEWSRQQGAPASR